MIFWIALGLLTLAWWPPFDFNGDEAWVMDYLLNGGKARMMLGWALAERGLLLLNTPLYFGYAGLFLRISENIWFMRLSSLLPGLFSLILVYLIARDEGYRWEGLVAVIILGLSGPFLWTSHYLRWESLTTLTGLAGVWLFM
ncbi:MAG: phospholipid carrier-dependent glycosyltransferase, partial [Candidatus Hydrothermia bacterium]